MLTERYKSGIEEVPESHHLRSGEELKATLQRYVRLYNQMRPQSAPGRMSPLQAMTN